MTKTFCAAFALASLVATGATAQAMFPMVEDGLTFTDKKGIMLTVVNPYQSAETFKLEAFETDYNTPTTGVAIQPSELTLGSSLSRRVRVIFDVPGKERTIAVCVQPVQEEAQVVPRVCGRYTARRAGIR
ncbi:MAG: hypothetical protein ACFBRM_12490 [Pikeienuella sp.]